MNITTAADTYVEGFQADGSFDVMKKDDVIELYSSVILNRTLIKSLSTTDISFKVEPNQDSNLTAVKTALNATFPIDVLNAVDGRMQIFLIVMYSLTALLSLIGNVTVISVLMYVKRSSRELRLLLINLAVSDITMAVFCIPFTYTQFLLNRWIFSPTFCPVVQFMQMCSVMASVYTLTIIGIDRYYAIICPLKAKWSRSRGAFMIILIWLISTFPSTYQLFNTEAKPFSWNNETYYSCEEVNEGKILTVIVFLVTYLFPLSIMTYCYVSIGIRLHKRVAPGNSHARTDTYHRRTKIKVVKMMVMIVVFFAFCWLPLHVFMMFAAFYPGFTKSESNLHNNFYIGTYFACHWLSMANSFINPFIYSFTCENFRVNDSVPSAADKNREAYR